LHFTLGFFSSPFLSFAIWETDSVDFWESSAWISWPKKHIDFSFIESGSFTCYLFKISVTEFFSSRTSWQGALDEIFVRGDFLCFENEKLIRCLVSSIKAKDLLLIFGLKVIMSFLLSATSFMILNWFWIF